eukprot:Blabericola_migrator_1__10681@NODE_609_length_7298_cov_332_353616_g442_i0_p1_GENE_NODE_609_length_7298_cov_332_353616_g442_i0NODE_609_length_7298_cov_332_353616_g442_i0_p1_ORF_typecomplete_len718_score67_70Pkinase/PF00069_25/9_2e74Pkinase_Tyr/PF07714_17/9_4e58Kinaselike/PF14531_6/2e16Pkinase_fungal/PF17667_1/2_2e12Kdo/PF06293_14/0_0003WaaY/PF06176_11/0_00043APH/PF01636_23/0_0044PIP49_C/PF12260_8/0_0031SAS4/PF15460_6/6_8SAS4/PF15460_6/9_3FTA2/PF13095_6/9_1FTA2/PF13095_6/44_NODE_609_length_7298_co
MLSTICEGTEFSGRNPTQGTVSTPESEQHVARSDKDVSHGKRYSQHLDDYEDLGEIGRGQFGSVHKVRLRSDPSVVLVWKKLDYQRMPEKEKRQLQQEVQLLQTLEHPHVVRYLGKINDKSNSHIYLLMEYCDGGDLSKYLDHTVRKGFPLPEDTILLWFAQLVDALHYCHTLPSGRVFHRDIKPQNVLICEKYRKVKLGDFGLAKMLKPQQHMAQTHVGTPYYMSPEVLNRSQYDAKSDIWSLGCLLFEMATGRSPHCKATTLEHLKSLVANNHIEKLPSMFSRELYSLILWMLTKNPANRPSTTDLKNTFAFRLGCFVSVGELITKVDAKRRALDKENKQLKAALEIEKNLRREDKERTDAEIANLTSQLEGSKFAAVDKGRRPSSAMPRLDTNFGSFLARPAHVSSWSVDRLPCETQMPNPVSSTTSTSAGVSSLPQSENEPLSPHPVRKGSHTIATRWTAASRRSGSLFDFRAKDDIVRPASQPTEGVIIARTTETGVSRSARENGVERRPSFCSAPAPMIETPRRKTLSTRSPRRAIASEYSAFQTGLSKRNTGHSYRSATLEPDSGRIGAATQPIIPRKSPFSTPLRKAEKLADRLPTRGNQGLTLRNFARTPTLSEAQTFLLRRNASKTEDSADDIGGDPSIHGGALPRRSPFSTPLRKAEKLVERLPTQRPTQGRTALFSKTHLAPVERKSTNHLASVDRKSTNRRTLF